MNMAHERAHNGETYAQKYLRARAEEKAAQEAHSTHLSQAQDAEQRMSIAGDEAAETAKLLGIDPDDGYASYDKGFSDGHETKVRASIWDPTSAQLQELMYACSPDDMQTRERWRLLIQKFQAERINAVAEGPSEPPSTTTLLSAQGFIREIEIVGYAVQSLMMERDVQTFMIAQCIGDGTAYKAARSCADNLAGGARFITLYGMQHNAP